MPGLFNLTAALKGSCLLTPWVQGATLSPASLLAGFNQSAVFSKLSLLCPDRGASTLTRLLEKLLLLGVCLLLCALTVFDTGPIGLLTWALFGVALLLNILRGFRPLQSLNTVDLLVMLFVGTAFISAAFSSFFATSLVGLSKMLTFCAGYWVFRTTLGGEPLRGIRPIYWLLGVLLGIGLLESLIGFYQYINHIQPLATWEDPSINPELKMNRIFGTLKPSNPNLLAGFLIPMVASGFGFALIGWANKKWLAGFLAFALGGVLLVALLLTGSRGGYLSIAMMAFVMFAMVGHTLWHEKTLQGYGKLKTIWLGVLVGVLFLVGLALSASPSLQHRVLSIFAMREDSSNAYRMNVYASATRMFLENPWVGIGPGNGTFKLVYGLYMVPGFNALGAYSVPLEIAVEQGVLGLLVFLLLVGVMKIRALLLMDSNASLTQRALVLLLWTGITGSLVYGIFDTIWYRPAVNLVFWLFVAAVGMETQAVCDGSVEPQDD